jgi:hypothetical protein
MSAVTISARGARLGVRIAFLGIAGVMISGAAPSQGGTGTPVFPLSFEQSGAAWIARGPGYRLAIEDGGAVLALWNERGQASMVGMRMVGAQRRSPGVPEGESEGRHNYLMGADPRRWRSNVRVWQAVRFAGVRDGVDIVYRGGGRRFEYDLEVAAGANPSAIRIAGPARPKSGWSSPATWFCARARAIWSNGNR